MEPHRTNDPISFHVEYSFSSNLDDRLVDDCVTTFTATIYANSLEEGDEDVRQELAGEMDFLIIHLGEALDADYNIFELFDLTASAYQVGEEIYDFEHDMLKEPVITAFPDLEIGCRRIFIIEGIGIVPKYREKGLALKAFRDLFRHFNYADLFVLEPFHLKMSESPVKGSLITKLGLWEFQQSEEAAFHMGNYFRSWGFKEIEGIADLMFYCPIYRNEAVEGIG